jgi:hypothetical protein
LATGVWSALAFVHSLYLGLAVRVSSEAVASVIASESHALCFRRVANE